MTYLHGNGGVSFSEASSNSPTLALIATAQDEIGWDNFVSGRISRHMRRYMQTHYESMPTQRLAASWSKELVHQLLQMVHEQWMVRNNYVHDVTELGEKREAVEELRDSLEAEFYDGTTDLAEEFHHLFEESFEKLWSRPVSARRQWLVEVTAAREISLLEATIVPVPRPPPEPPPVERPSQRRRRLAPNISGRRRRRDSD